MSEQNAPNRTSMLERHIQSVALAVVVAVLLWVGSTVQTTSIKVGVIETRTEAIGDRVDFLASDRYTGSQAAADHARVMREISRLEERQNRLDERMLQLEREEP